MKQVLLLVLLTLCLSGQAHAAAELPDELALAAPEAAALVSQDAADSFGLLSGVQSIIQDALAEWQSGLFAGARSAAAIMTGVILLGVVESASPAGRETISRWSGAAGALWITAAAAGELNAFIGLGRETISDISLLSKALLPALAAAEAASGGVTAAAVRQMAAVFFSDILLTVIEKLLLPMVYLYIGTATAGAVIEGDVMERIGELLKKAITWILSGLLILFTAYLTISGAIAGAADVQAVKLAKAAVSTAVPVVGGILSDAAESVMAGAGLLRGMAGTAGALALLGTCLAPFLHLGFQYLLYQGASLVASASGPKKLSKLISMLGDAFGLVLGMTGAAAILLLISLLSSVTALTPS